MALPEIISVGKYAVVRDQYSNEKVLQNPPKRAILLNNAGEIMWQTGEEDGLILDSLKKIEQSSFAMNHVLAATTGGAIVRFGPTVGENKTLNVTFVNGVLKLVENSGLPANGTGVLVKNPSGQAAYLTGKGVVLVNESGVASLVSYDTDGQVLKVIGGVPTFVAEGGSASAAGAGNTIGLEGVIATSLSNSTLSVKANVLTVVDVGGNEVRLRNINQGANIAAGNVAGGLDTGAEAQSKWYAVYIIYNPDTDTQSAIISEDFSAPDLSGIEGYTHYALASLFRNDAAGNIRAYRQRGRRFWTYSVEVGAPLSVGTTYAAAVTPTLPSIIPPIARSCAGQVGGRGGTSGETAESPTWVASDASGLGEMLARNFNTASVTVNGFRMDVGDFDNLLIDDPTAPQIFWKSTRASTRRRLTINGYSI